MGRRVVVEADGGSRGNPGPAGFGAVVKDAETGEVIAEVAAGIGVDTNNVAEYRGLIAGLEACAGVEDLEAVQVRMDSKLVVEQMSGRWKVKAAHIQPLLEEGRAAAQALGVRVTYAHIPRALNSHADRLANEAMDAAARGEQWTRASVAHVDAAAEPAEHISRNRLSGWSDPSAPPTTTLLLRHGQTEHSVEKRFSGRSDLPLTDAGLSQAAAAADRLAGMEISAIVSSPLSRARTTAAAVADRLGLEVAVDDGFRETDFGDWEGLTFAQVREKWPAELTAWLASDQVAPPGGESFAATERRVRAARDRVIAEHPGQVVLVVSHVTPIKLLARLALGAPPEALYRMHLDLVSLTTVDWHADGVAVLRGLNDVSHAPVG